MKQPTSAPDVTVVEEAGSHPLPTSSAEDPFSTPDSVTSHSPKQGVHSSPEWEVSEQEVPHTPEQEVPHTPEQEVPHASEQAVPHTPEQAVPRQHQAPHPPEHEVTPSGVDFEEVFMVSALTGDGVDDLRVI